MCISVKCLRVSARLPLYYKVGRSRFVGLTFKFTNCKALALYISLVNLAGFHHSTQLHHVPNKSEWIVSTGYISFGQHDHRNEGSSDSIEGSGALAKHSIAEKLRRLYNDIPTEIYRPTSYQRDLVIHGVWDSYYESNRQQSTESPRLRNLDLIRSPLLARRARQVQFTSSLYQKLKGTHITPFKRERHSSNNLDLNTYTHSISGWLLLFEEKAKRKALRVHSEAAFEATFRMLNRKRHF